MTMPEATVLISPAERRARLLFARAAHWRQTRRVTAILLALWLATSIGTVWFARELDQWSLFGWPLSFYMAAQGASLIYLAVIGAYAWLMRRADARYAHALDLKP
jgi:putative solute:sodium symporter small subunit